MAVFKPLTKSNKKIPETFKNLVFAEITDLEIQKEPASWFTRNKGSVTYNKDTDTVIFKNGKFLYKGALEVTIPKGYLIEKNFIILTGNGFGWVSVKLIESTITKGGAQTESFESWKKLDTVREKEVLFLSSEVTTKKLKIDSFHNKPINVAFNAFLKGFKKINKAKLTSLEITVRVGNLSLKRVEFV